MIKRILQFTAQFWDDFINFGNKTYEVDRTSVTNWAKENYDDKLSHIAIKVAYTICKQIGIDVLELTKETRFIHDLGVYDNFDSIRFVQEIEHIFQIEIPDADAEKMTYFDQLVEYINKKIES